MHGVLRGRLFDARLSVFLHSGTRTQEHADVGELAGCKIHKETTWRIAFFGMNTIHFQILYKGMSANIKRFPIEL